MKELFPFHSLNRENRESNLGIKKNSLSRYITVVKVRNIKTNKSKTNKLKNVSTIR